VENAQDCSIRDCPVTDRGTRNPVTGRRWGERKKTPQTRSSDAKKKTTTINR